MIALGPHRAEPAIYFRPCSRSCFDRRTAGRAAHADRHLSRYPDPRDRVVWNYTGMPPDQMAGRITTPFQRALTTTVNDIEHIVANSYNGIGIIKIFFQAQCRYPHRQRAGHGDFANDDQAAAAGRDARR